MATPTTENQIASFENTFHELPAQMRIFSLCMRSLYAESAVGSDTEEVKKFRQLRDNTRDDALAYLKGILPVVSLSVANIGDYFELYVALDIDEWWECLDDVIEEATKYHESCQILIKLHEDILVPLKKREDEAKILYKQMEKLTEVFKRDAAKLRDEASNKRGWAIGLAFIPLVGAIAAPILGIQADSVLAEAVAKSENAQVNAMATKVVCDALVPALNSFIRGLEQVAGFFEIIMMELQSFKGKGQDAAIKKSQGQETPMKLHYKCMKNKATNVKKGCHAFHAILPSVRTDFAAIPFEGVDQNYVDKWLQQQKKVIEEKAKAAGLKSLLMKAIS